MRPPDTTATDAVQHFQRAQQLHQSGALAEALAGYDRALAMAPHQAEWRFYRAELLQGMGRLDEALAGYAQVLAAEPRAAPAHVGKGNALMSLGRPAEALLAYDAALALLPGVSVLHANRADALRALGRPEEALAAADRAIQLEPGHPIGPINRGAALMDLGRYEEALAAYDRAIALHPRFAEAHSNRANALRGLGRLEEALESSGRALTLQPNAARALQNRASVLMDLGRYAEAREAFDAALALAPDMHGAAVGAAHAHLMLGDFEGGWALMEHRWAQTGGPALLRERAIDAPAWRGKESLAGKTILLRGEQGLGDVIQFCRYAPRVKAMGARVVLEVEPGLRTLMGSLDGVDQLISAADPLPHIDYQCPLMSLPHALGTTLETVPADIPYLAADPDKVATWRARLGERRHPRIGLVWSGGRRPHQPGLWNVSDRRNIPLTALASLAAIEAEFHSLQKGEAAEQELKALQASGWSGPAITDHAAELKDLSDTAALIESLDAVVSVCTAVAHLSGALGKPTFVLLHTGACWRWMEGRADTPWYPTARLIRQSAPGDWTRVAQDLTEALRQPFG